MGQSKAIPKVSVSIICFNQSQFIEQTLAAITSQETDFSYEIVVSDDASTDGTAEIIKTYQERFPELIRLQVNESRLGMKANFLNNLDRCRGRFIALCDGDDVWISNKKLQLQTDFLESNKEFSAVFHRVRHESARGHLFQELPKVHMRKPRLTAEDLISEGAFMPTSSIMFRTTEDGAYPEWLWSMENIVDFPLNLSNAMRGDIGYIDATLGIYRTASSPSAYSSSPVATILDETFRMYEIMIKNFPDEIGGGLRAHQLKILRHLVLAQAFDDRSHQVGPTQSELARFRQIHDFQTYDLFDVILLVVKLFSRLRLSKSARWIGLVLGAKYLP